MGRKPPDTDVVIVGGGVAGLTTAYLLQKKGIRFKLLESRPDIGGNTRGGKTQDGVHYPKGASVFYLGEKHHQALWKELGLPLQKSARINRPDYIVEKGIPPYHLSSPASIPATRKEITAQYDRLTRFLKNQISHLNKNPSNQAYYDGMSFGELIRRAGFQSVMHLLAPVVRSDFNAEMDQLSALSGLWDQAEDQGEQYLLPGGNYYLSNRLRERVQRKNPFAIQTGSRAESVIQQRDRVKVRYRTAQGRHTVTARYVLLGVPYSQAPRLARIPKPYAKLMQSLPQGPYTLVNMFLKEKPSDIEESRFYITPDSVFSDFVLTTLPSRKGRNSQPAVITFYLPQKGEHKDADSLYNAIRKDFTALFPHLRMNGIRFERTVYPISMTAPKPGQAIALQKMPSRFGRLLLIHSDGGRVPSVLTAVDRAMDAVGYIEQQVMQRKVP